MPAHLDLYIARSGFSREKEGGGGSKAIGCFRFPRRRWIAAYRNDYRGERQLSGSSWEMHEQPPSRIFCVRINTNLIIRF